MSFLVSLAQVICDFLTYGCLFGLLPRWGPEAFRQMGFTTKGHEGTRSLAVEFFTTKTHEDARSLAAEFFTMKSHEGARSLAWSNLPKKKLPHRGTDSEVTAVSELS